MMARHPNPRILIDGKKSNVGLQEAKNPFSQFLQLSASSAKGEIQIERINLPISGASSKPLIEMLFSLIQHYDETGNLQIRLQLIVWIRVLMNGRFSLHFDLLPQNR
jgi:hypothetical protein